MSQLRDNPLLPGSSVVMVTILLWRAGFRGVIGHSKSNQVEGGGGVSLEGEYQVGPGCNNELRAAGTGLLCIV